MERARRWSCRVMVALVASGSATCASGCIMSGTSPHVTRPIEGAPLDPDPRRRHDWGHTSRVQLRSTWIR